MSLSNLQFGTKIILKNPNPTINASILSEKLRRTLGEGVNTYDGVHFFLGPQCIYTSYQAESDPILTVARETNLTDSWDNTQYQVRPLNTNTTKALLEQPFWQKGFLNPIKLFYSKKIKTRKPFLAAERLALIVQNNKPESGILATNKGDEFTFRKHPKLLDKFILAGLFDN